MSTRFTASLCRSVLTAVALSVAITLSAQTVYIPSGTSGIGSISGSNVGVGTNSPGVRLDVVGAGTDDVIGRFRSKRSNVYLNLIAGSSDDAAGELSFERTAANAGNWYLGGNATGNITFRSGGYVNRMTINSLGKVGIGIGVPLADLHIKTATGPTQLRLETVDAGNAIQFQRGATVYNSIASPYSVPGDLALLDSGSVPRLYLASTGNLGVSTTSPRASLDVGSFPVSIGQLRTVLARLQEGDATNGGTYLGVRSWATQPGAGVKMFSLEDAFYGDLNSSISFHRGGGTTGGFLTFGTGNGSERLRIDGAGNVGIGTTTPSHKLAVNGTVRAKEVIVDNTGWPDYVFERGYRLASLREVESHIQEKKHLPGIPSASEIAANGVSMGEMQAKLLRKIEELTLHVIAQEKQITRQAERISALEHQKPTSP